MHMPGEHDYGQLAEGSADVAAFLRTQSNLTSGAVLVLTYSARYGFPTMSGYVTDHANVLPGSAEVQAWLDDLRGWLEMSTNIASTVMSFIRETTGIAAKMATRPPERPGEVAIAVAAPDNEHASREVPSIVRAIVSSRSAAFHVENGIDLALRLAASPASVLEVPNAAHDLAGLEASLPRRALTALLGGPQPPSQLGACVCLKRITARRHQLLPGIPMWS
jgi:hypothetical protein